MAVWRVVLAVWRVVLAVWRVVLAVWRVVLAVWRVVLAVATKWIKEQTDVPPVFENSNQIIKITIVVDVRNGSYQL